MSIWAALAGGFAGTLVLTTVLRTATELHLTRMDLPFLLGTAVTADRARAKVIGYAAHFGFGLVFALGYYGLFAAVGRHDWWLGALFGLGQSLFAGTFLVNVLLPLVHPRMGTPLSDAGTRRAARTARVHAPQLRPADPRGQPRGARPLRHDHRTVPHPRRLTRSSCVQLRSSLADRPAEAQIRFLAGHRLAGRIVINLFSCPGLKGDFACWLHHPGPPRAGLASSPGGATNRRARAADTVGPAGAASGLHASRPASRLASRNRPRGETLGSESGMEVGVRSTGGVCGLPAAGFGLDMMVRAGAGSYESGEARSPAHAAGPRR